MAASADADLLTGPDLAVSASPEGLTIRWPAHGAELRCAGPRVTIDGEALGPGSDGWVTTVRRWSVDDALGSGDALVVTCELGDLARIELVVRLGSEPTHVVVSAQLANLADRPLSVRDLSLLGDARLSLGDLGGGHDAPTVYVDSGSQGGTHIARLDAARTCRGICAVYDPAADLCFLCSFLSFEHDNLVSTEPARDEIALNAATSTPLDLAPGEVHDFDPVLLDCRPSPYEALERYADAVRAHVQPPIPDEMPSGWISWYGYRLTMTEETVLENAEVIARRFRHYGVNIIQPDHGWQYRDICGNWVVNEKFPHGMPWLAERLEGMGFELGLWAAPSVVSEFAPIVRERPEALICDPDGSPRVRHERWTWPPHGCTHLIDPWTPAGEAFLREFADRMRGFGVSYLKADFIGNWGGARTLRHGMSILREALGPDIILRPCSTALNTNLGLCNEIGIARDIGNAAGNWGHMQVEALELATKWFMHDRFWLNNPDSLIVGDPNETLGEALGRVTMHALTGGVMFLADRMPELEQQPERLALVPLVLPSSGVPARPIDLFRIGVDNRDYPRLWHLHAEAAWGEWEVLGILNWSDETLTETVRLADLGLSEGDDHLVWDFWHQTLAGRFTRDFEVAVPPGTARCLRIMRLPDRPSVLSTTMHVTQGLVDVADVRWDADGLTLSGLAQRAAGASGAIVLYVPGGYALAEGESPVIVEPFCARLEIEFPDATVEWSVGFAQAESREQPALDPADSILCDASMPQWRG